MTAHVLFMTAITLLTFLILLLLVRWIGSTQLSQITFFNWVAGACMGNLGANMIASRSVKDWAQGTYLLVVFTAATIIAAFLALKFRGLRRLANGEPIVVIHKGQLLRQNLRRTKLNIDVLMMLLRQKGYFAYEEIDYAILEPAGSLSILPLQEAQSVSKKDLIDGPNLSKEGNGPYIEIVVDGEIDRDKLYTTGHDTVWLEKKILDAGAKGLEDITYLAVNREGHVIVDSNRRRDGPERDPL